MDPFTHAGSGVSKGFFVEGGEHIENVDLFAPGCT